MSDSETIIAAESSETSSCPMRHAGGIALALMVVLVILVIGHLVCSAVFGKAEPMKLPAIATRFGVAKPVAF